MPAKTQIRGNDDITSYPSKEKTIHTSMQPDRHPSIETILSAEEIQENRSLTIADAQREVDHWVKTYGVRYFSELTNMACLTEEVGELARIIARRYGDQSFKKGETDNIGEELADVLWVLICLANQTGTDLTAELRKSISKKTARDKDRHINNPKLK